MVKNDIFGLDVFMDHILRMHAIQGLDDRSRDELNLALCEAAFPVDVIPKVASGQIVHDHVNTLIVLKSRIQFGDKRRVELAENQAFSLHRVFEFLLPNTSFISTWISSFL